MDGTWTHQHIYIVSHDKIDIGNWYLRSHDNTIGVANLNSDHNVYDCKKIIATTNEALQLPAVSDAFIAKFIEKYNENKPITDVMVEEEQCNCMCHNPKEMMMHFMPCCYPGRKTLKVSGNFITITKCKDTWTREEVLQLLRNNFANQDTIDWFNNQY